MSTDNVTPICPRSILIVSRSEGLRLAARLLRVAVSAFGEDQEPCFGDADFDDVLGVVRVAKEHVKAWLKGIDEVREQHVFAALDVLNLVEVVLGREPDQSIARTVRVLSPIRNCLQAAVTSLQIAVEEEDDRPEDPDDGDEHEEENAQAA